MRSLSTRRAVGFAGAATVAVLALAGCSAGQTAETSILQSPISGLNTASPDGSLLIRNLQVAYKDSTGYAANSTAPIEVSLFNQTQDQITVTITSTPQQSDGVVSAQKIGVTSSSSSASSAPSAASPLPSDSASASSSPSADDSEAAAQPAQVTIGPLSSVSFRPGQVNSLVASGLSGALAPGRALALTVQSSSNATPLNVLAPVANPLSAGSRAPAVEGENAEGGE